MSKVIMCFLLMCGVASAETVKLGTGNTVMVRGEINGKSMDEAARRLILLDTMRGNRKFPIYLVFDSPGGDIEAGENFIEIAKGIKNVQTITVFAASMASAIVEALPGNRLILSSGVMMFHRAAGQVGGQFETGELESRLDFYKRYVRRMEQRNADRMSMKLDDYKANVKDELWLTSGDALSKKAADSEVSVSCSKKLIDDKQVVRITFFIYEIDLAFSGCPLFRNPQVLTGQKEETVEAYYKWKGLQNEANQKY